VARFGDDATTFHVQWGGVSFVHESMNRQDTMWTVGQLVQLAKQAAERATARLDRCAPPIDPKQIPLVVDDDGVGGGVTDRLRELGYFVRAVRAGSTAHAPSDYPNLRSELWFQAADQAHKGKMSLAKLPTTVRQKLKLQAMAPRWKLDSEGRRVVERKDETKKRLGRSPDDMDALNLAYLPMPRVEIPVVQRPPPRSLLPDPQSQRQDILQPRGFRDKQARLRPRG